MLQLDQLQAASYQAHQYVRFWGSVIRTARNEEIRYYCIKRYKRALTCSAECNRLICEYLGRYV